MRCTADVHTKAMAPASITSSAPSQSWPLSTCTGTTSIAMKGSAIVRPIALPRSPKFRNQIESAMPAQNSAAPRARRNAERYADKPGRKRDCG